MFRHIKSRLLFLPFLTILLVAQPALTAVNPPPPHETMWTDTNIIYGCGAILASVGVCYCYLAGCGRMPTYLRNFFLAGGTFAFGVGRWLYANQVVRDWPSPTSLWYNASATDV